MDVKYAAATASSASSADVTFVPLVASARPEYHQPDGFSKIILFSELHSWNAPGIIFITEVGIVILSSEVHPRNML